MHTISGVLKKETWAARATLRAHLANPGDETECSVWRSRQHWLLITHSLPTAMAPLQAEHFLEPNMIGGKKETVELLQALKMVALKMSQDEMAYSISTDVEKAWVLYVE